MRICRFTFALAIASVDLVPATNAGGRVVERTLQQVDPLCSCDARKCCGDAACGDHYGSPLTDDALAKISVGSCCGDSSCYYLSGDVSIGQGSCIGSNACYGLGADVGSDSCQGYRSCAFNRATVGDCQCIGDNSCKENALDKPGTCAATAAPEWNIAYNFMKANLTADSIDELVFSYTVSSPRAYEYELFQKDCITSIGGNLIASNRSDIGSSVDGTAPLTLFFDVNKTAIASSPIWNQTSDEMEMCIVLSLFEPATNDVSKMIVAQDKRVFTVGVNSTVEFSFANAAQDSAAGEDSESTNLADYVEACKCTGDEAFVCDSTPLAPNEELHVCIKSSSPDVQIRDVVEMNIDQGASKTLTVIDEGEIKYSSFSSKNSIPAWNGYKINVLLPINLFVFSGSNVTIDGVLEMQLGGGRRALRKLASGNGPEAAPFKLEIALTDTQEASKVNDAAEEDSAPPGYLVPVLVVVGLVSLLAMAGMAMAFRKRGARGSRRIVA